MCTTFMSSAQCQFIAEMIMAINDFCKLFSLYRYCPAFSSSFLPVKTRM